MDPPSTDSNSLLFFKFYYGFGGIPSPPVWQISLHMNFFFFWRHPLEALKFFDYIKCKTLEFLEFCFLLIIVELWILPYETLFFGFVLILISHEHNCYSGTAFVIHQWFQIISSPFVVELNQFWINWKAISFYLATQSLWG